MDFAARLGEPAARAQRSAAKRFRLAHASLRRFEVPSVPGAGRRGSVFRKGRGGQMMVVF